MNRDVRACVVQRAAMTAPMRFAAPVTSAQRPSRVVIVREPRHQCSASPRLLARKRYTIDTPMILSDAMSLPSDFPEPSAAALAVSAALVARDPRARSSARAAGSISRATWSSRCMRRGSATTAPAARSSAPRAISSRRPSSAACSVARSRAPSTRSSQRLRRRTRSLSSARAAARSRRKFSTRSRDSDARRVSDPRAERGLPRTPARSARARSAGAWQWLDRLPDAAVRRRIDRERGARRVAGLALREARRPRSAARRRRAAAAASRGRTASATKSSLRPSRRSSARSASTCRTAFAVKLAPFAARVARER